MFGRRIFAALIFLTFLAVTFWGCSFFPGSSSSESTNPAATATTPTTSSTDYPVSVRGIASQTVLASTGGVIEITGNTPSKGIKLSIPPNALKNDTTISIGEVDSPPELPKGHNYVGCPIDLTPDGTTFLSSCTLEIPYTEASLNNAGFSDDSTIEVFYFDRAASTWNKLNVFSIDRVNKKIQASLSHFSMVSITITGQHQDPPSDLGTPQPGDLLYKLGSWRGALLPTTVFKYLPQLTTKGTMWRPGHVGIYVGEKKDSDGKPYNVVEALGDGVTRSYYNPINEFSWNGIDKNNKAFDTYMGARQPKGIRLKRIQREAIVNFVDDVNYVGDSKFKVIGRRYALGKIILGGFGILPGSAVKGENLPRYSFNCVGLAEKAYETGLVGGGIGLVTTEDEEDGTLLDGSTFIYTQITGISSLLDYFELPLTEDPRIGLTTAEQYSKTEPAKGFLAPTIKIISPKNGDSFKKGDSVNISADVQEEGYSIANVEIYHSFDPTNTGKLTKIQGFENPPYTMTWQDIPGSDFNILVAATDNYGFTATSSVSLSSTGTTTGTSTGTTTTTGTATGTTTTTDTTKPVISAVTSGSLAQTSAAITWTTDEDSTSQVEYGTTTAYGSTTTLDSTKTKSHSVSVTALTAATAYHYRVKSKDAAGNEAVSTDNAFTTTTTTSTGTPGGTTQVLIGGGQTMYFAEISAGSFQMGEAGYEEPVHQVTIGKAFYMGKHEVTQAQYKQLMGTNPSYFTPSNSYASTDNQPVEQVSWFDSVRFCNTLSANQSLTPCYTNQSGNSTITNTDTVTCNWAASGYRLPTESEWEYACRAGTTLTYPWGSDSSEATVKQYAWYYLNAYDSYWTTPHAVKSGTQPVGTKLPNAFGLYDMSGNVWEWCWDWYGSYSSSVQTDPKGADSGSYRVIRGSSWPNQETSLGSGLRFNGVMPPTARGYDSGFRVCRTKQ